MTNKNKNHTQKVAKVNEINEIINNSEGIVFSYYSGLSANQLTDFRKNLKENDISVSVCKNTLTTRAFKINNFDIPDHLSKGPIVLTNTPQDFIKMSKMLIDFEKNSEKFSVQGAFFNQSFIDKTQVAEIAKLPSREVLLGKLVSLLKSPLTNLVYTLKSPLSSTINVLDNIKKQKIGGDKV